MTEHRFLMMDLNIRRKRIKILLYDQPKIKFGTLTKDKVQELGRKLLLMRAWRSRRDVSSIWSKIATCIKEASREVIGVSKDWGLLVEKKKSNEE